MMTVKAIVRVENLKSTDSKYCIVRNLTRILDLRILKIDIESRTIHFVYDSILAFEKAKRELLSIGYPVSRCRYQEPHSQWRANEDPKIEMR
jgi:hypothetical protein